MERKGYTVFPYAKDALEVYKEKVDVVVSFGVIEHVEDPTAFLQDAYDFLKPGGKCYIMTVTEAPVMRKLLGDTWDSFIFSTQHTWVLVESSFKYMAHQCGIENFMCRYYQKYGLGNLMYWLLNKQPGRHKQYDFISKAVDQCWKASLEEQKLGDVIVFECIK